MHVKVYNAPYARPLVMLRNICDLTQDSMAEFIGIKTYTLQRAEKGESTRSTVMAAVAALGLTADREVLDALVSGMDAGRRVRVVSVEIEFEPEEEQAGVA